MSSWWQSTPPTELIATISFESSDQIHLRNNRINKGMYLSSWKILWLALSISKKDLNTLESTKIWILEAKELLENH